MNNNKKISAMLGEYAAFIALILLALGLCIISPEFRQVSNLLNLLRQAAFNGLIAIGMTCVILSDGIDLSVGSVFALAAIMCAEMLTAGMPAPVAILAALVATVTKADGKSQNTTITVALVEEDDGWRIDNPTYANYNEYKDRYDELNNKDLK